MYKATLDGAQEVAVKFMRPDISSLADSLRRFQTEITIMRACRDSPFIVSFLGAWVHEVSHLGHVMQRGTQPVLCCCYSTLHTYDM